MLQALKHRSVEYIVAPYEADAQMAYLARNGLVDAVLTEDSDLLCYGCPTASDSSCSDATLAPHHLWGNAWPTCYRCFIATVQVFFKMEKGGEGEEIQLCDLPQCKELAFQGFGHDLFQEVGRRVCGGWDGTGEGCR